jgi:hypothetical protein
LQVGVVAVVAIVVVVVVAIVAVVVVVAVTIVVTVAAVAVVVVVVVVHSSKLDVKLILLKESSSLFMEAPFVHVFKKGNSALLSNNFA